MFVIYIAHVRYNIHHSSLVFFKYITTRIKHIHATSILESLPVLKLRRRAGEGRMCGRVGGKHEKNMNYNKDTGEYVSPPARGDECAGGARGQADGGVACSSRLHPRHCGRVEGPPDWRGGR